MNFADQRVLKSTPATLVGQFVDQDGANTAPTTPVTVGVVRADGTVLLAPGTATSAVADTTSAFSVALTVAQTATLDHLTVTWTAASGQIVVTHVDVVGGFGFSLADVAGLDGMGNLTTQRKRDLRQAVEELVEERTGWCWTPRLVVDSFPAYPTWGMWGASTDSIRLTKRPFRTLRSVRVDNVAQTLGVNGWSALEYGQLSSVTGYTGLTATAQQVVVAYEAGEDRPPASLVNTLLAAAQQGQLDRASAGQGRNLSIVNEFGNITFARATAENLFGNPAVDAVLALWDRRMVAIA